MLLNALFDRLLVEGRQKVTVRYDIAKQQTEEEGERVERETARIDAVEN